MAILSYPWIREILQERAFIKKYSQAKDFWSVYPVMKENQKLIAQNPKNEGAYYSLGQGLYSIGAFPQAIDAFSHTVEISPQKYYYWSFLGKAYQGKKDYQKARDAYSKALELEPNNANNYTMLAWLYYFRLEPEKEKAFEILKKGLEKFPDNKDILFDITRYYLYDKSTTEFRKYAPLYLKIDPSSPAIQEAYEKGIQ